MSIFTDPPITWTSDTKCDTNTFNREIKEKMDEIDSFASSVVGARAYLSSDQLNTSNNAFTKILLNTESFDFGSNFNVGTNRFIVPVTDCYIINGCIYWKDGTVVANKKYMVAIYKNGSALCLGGGYSSETKGFACNVGDIQYLTAGDYIELYAYHYAGIATVDISGSAVSTFMAILKR